MEHSVPAKITISDLSSLHQMAVADAVKWRRRLFYLALALSAVSLCALACMSSSAFALYIEGHSAIGCEIFYSCVGAIIIAPPASLLLFNRYRDEKERLVRWWWRYEHGQKQTEALGYAMPSTCTVLPPIKPTNNNDLSSPLSDPFLANVIPEILNICLKVIPKV